LRVLSSEIIIDAPADLVWRVLVDFGSYHEWNPVESDVRGEARVGATLEHTSKLPNRKPMSFRATIVQAEPPRALAWRGRILVPGIFDVRHHFEIDSLDDDRSRLRQFEHFSGLLVPFTPGVLRDTQAAFELANAAIKERAERLAERTSGP